MTMTRGGGRCDWRLGFDVYVNGCVWFDDGVEYKYIACIDRYMNRVDSTCEAEREKAEEEKNG